MSHETNNQQLGPAQEKFLSGLKALRWGTQKEAARALGFTTQRLQQMRGTLSRRNIATTAEIDAALARKRTQLV